MPSYESLLEQREEIAYFMRRLYAQGLTTCSGGNISLRVGDSHALVTPSALDKGRLQADQICLFTMAGENLTPHLKGSIETGMHLAVLRARKDIQAVVHAHPVTATAFAAMDMEIDCRLTAESYYFLRTPKRSGYSIMGSEGLADIVAEALKDVDVSLMQNHGVITVGSSVMNAFDKMEVTEAAAKMTWIARSLKASMPLTPEQVEEIDQKLRK